MPLPNNATPLQGGKLYKPVGIPAGDDDDPVRDLTDEPELSIQKYLELIPFLGPAIVFADSPTCHFVNYLA